MGFDSLAAFSRKLGSCKRSLNPSEFGGLLPAVPFIGKTYILG